MSSQSSFYVRSALAALALLAVTLAPSVRGDNADTRANAGAPNAAASASAPIVLAQGRCYNGRCY